MNLQLKRLYVLAVTISLLPSFGMQPTDAAVVKKRGAPAASGGGDSGGGSEAYSSLPPTATPLDHNNRAVSLGQRGMWAQAVTEHEIALNGDPYNPIFKRNLSGAYLRFGQSLMGHNPQEAVRKFHMALYVDPNNVTASDCLATCYKALGKKIDDNPAEVHKQEGEKYIEAGNYAEAIAEFQGWVRATDSGEAHAALGGALLKQGQIVPARAVEGFNELKTALSKDWPKDQPMELARVHCLLADTLKDLAQKAKERGAMETALKRLDNAGIEYRRAASLMGEKNLEAARGLVEVAREAVAINPNSFDNHLMLGGAYQLLGDLDRAKKEYEACWRIKPNDQKLATARLSYHRAVITSPTSQPMAIAASVQKIEDLLKKNPNDADMLFIYGIGKDKLGEHDVAVQAYQAAMQINPYVDPELRRKMGMPVADAQQPLKAASGGGLTANGGFQPAVRPVGGGPGGAPGIGAGAGTPPPIVDPNLALVTAMRKKFDAGDADGAEKDATALLDKDPKAGKAWLIAGLAQEKKNELDDASVSFRQASYLLPDDPEAKSGLKRVDGTRARPYIQKGDDAVRQKNNVEAAEDYKQALSITPEDLDTHDKLLAILTLLGDNKAIESEKNAINRVKNPPPPPMKKASSVP